MSKQALNKRLAFFRSANSLKSVKVYEKIPQIPVSQFFSVTHPSHTFFRICSYVWGRERDRERRKTERPNELGIPVGVARMLMEASKQKQKKGFSSYATVVVVFDTNR